VSFADGSLMLFGDNSPGTAATLLRTC